MIRITSFILFYTLLSSTISAHAQKPPIDTSVFNQWPSLEQNPLISNDGKYFCYVISNQPVGGNTLVIQATNNSWKKELAGVRPGIFSGDSKLFIFITKDTLCFLQMGTDNLISVPAVEAFTSPATNKGKWLAYKLKGTREVILQNVISKKQQRYTNVDEYNFDNKGTVLLLKSTTGETGLQWVSLIDLSVKTIWSAKDSTGSSSVVSNHSFDPFRNQLAFIVQTKKANQFKNSIWYYKAGMDRAILQVDQSILDSTLNVSAIAPRFSFNGKYVFFALQQASVFKPNPNAVKVDIWSYKDVELQSKQLGALPQSLVKNFTAVFEAGGKGFIRLEKEDDKLLIFPESVTGDYAVIKDNNSVLEPWWNLTPQPNAYLISLIDGSRKLLIDGMQKGDVIYSFSPNGEVLVYFDSKQKNYFSYSVKTGNSVNCTRQISSVLCTTRGKMETLFPVGIAGWIQEDESLLVYDNYDIWRVDPTGGLLPVNITNNYGHNHQVKFTLVDGADYMFPAVVFKKKDELLLTAYNYENKKNGFFQMNLDKKADPELLKMDDGILYQKVNIWVQNGMRPLKAANSNTWIVKQERAISAPNYYLTHDFKTYTALTNIEPQKKYNWLSAELVNWKQLDGTNGQGILYKPENFDPQKKYPIIFLYYEDETNRLHTFTMPAFSNTAEINIPWFVSNDYLVFMPDIDFSIAAKSDKTTGENAYNAVVSAAEYFSKMPWVNAARMGINGHSTGGGETNFILTHSNLFAAAVEGAGVSNNVSDYGSLSGAGETRQFREESMGASLWQRPDLYIRNSAVFMADKVTTPLLIMHNKKDGSVPWAQGVELFLALRRLGKKVWMLQYDEEGHGIYGSNNAKDFTIRLSQFFDHYLKGAPPPNWMTKGIPAKLKGVNTGVTLDNNSNIP